MWVDVLIKDDLPDPEADSTLFELVKAYQLHRYQKSRRAKSIETTNVTFHLDSFSLKGQ